MREIQYDCIYFQEYNITNCFTRFHAIFGYLLIYFFVYFFVYLEGGGRFKLEFGLSFHFQKFELNLSLSYERDTKGTTTFYVV